MTLPRVSPSRLLAAPSALALLAAGAFAQGAAPAQAPTESERIARLEAQNEELARRVEVLGSEMQGLSLRDLIPPMGSSQYGLGPAASKIYDAPPGVSIGGYGEMIYQNFQGAGSDQLDFTRAVLYVGYKFDERWVFNSEIEVEHADEIFLEFAYLDYLHARPLNARAGMVLLPMGFVNEMHEPTTFPSVLRPDIERFIMPSTWRENGAGIFGEIGDFEYRTYVVNGLNASGFRASGLRGGRQKGSEALAEDFAWTGRLDYTGIEGLLVGASAYVGDSGQGNIAGGDVSTRIFDAHAQYRWRNLSLRGLYAQAELDDVEELNAALALTGANSVGERLEGYYLEAAVDVMPWLRPGSRKSLSPFVRYESYDTQDEVPSGFLSNPARDVDVLTFGVAYQPIEQIVFKIDYQDRDNGAGTAVDQLNVSLGYIF